MKLEVINEEIMNSLIVEAILAKSESRGSNIELIDSAYQFAKEAIKDRLRDDGTTFVGHFIRVAAILALELEIIDSEVIAAGFLHALPTHTEVSYQTLEEKLGKRIADSIKLLTIHSEEDQKHEALIKSLDESTEIMGALVKLSDRLDNIRRLRFAERPGKREYYIQQTENLYIPFAKKMNSYIYNGIFLALQKVRGLKRYKTMRTKVEREIIINSLIAEAVFTKAKSRGLDVRLIESAYEFSKEAVGYRLRESDGTTFIGHFIRVAAILALELEVTDSEIIASGFLHALVAHTDVTYEMLADKFGNRMSNLINLWTLRSEDDQKHRNLIQQLEESSDRLAALVKLSDRLDNFRRLMFADRPGKREQYIQQTENLYLPFAKRTNEYVYKGFLRTLEKLRVN